MHSCAWKLINKLPGSGSGRSIFMYGIIFNNSVHKNFYKSERFIKPDLPFTWKIKYNLFYF